MNSHGNSFTKTWSRTPSYVTVSSFWRGRQASAVLIFTGACGIGAVEGKNFQKKPTENAVDTSRMLAELQKTAALLAGNLGSSIGLRLLDSQSTFQFFS